jgi:nucleoside-diphosphate-sugar epimerase
MTILITGAAGEIGSRMVHRFHEQGHRVRALVLPGDPLAARLGDTARIHVGDVTKPETLPAAFADVEVVYHLAAVLLCEKAEAFQAVNVEGTRNVAAAAEATGVHHLVHISSASVVYPRTTHYSRSKRQAEDIVTACRKVRWTLVRPTLVYDRDGGLEFKLYADFVKRYPVVPLVAGGRARKSPVHVDDLLSGLLAMAGNPVTFSKTYNLSSAGPHHAAGASILISTVEPVPPEPPEAGPVLVESPPWPPALAPPAPGLSPTDGGGELQPSDSSTMHAQAIPVTFTRPKDVLRFIVLPRFATANELAPPESSNQSCRSTSTRHMRVTLPK